MGLLRPLYIHVKVVLIPSSSFYFAVFAALREVLIRRKRFHAGAAKDAKEDEKSISKCI